MDDVERYIRERSARDPEFAEGFDSGYAEFKIGVMLRRAREEAGLTQEQIAEKLRTKKSAISRIETRAGDIRLSTLEKYAKALGRDLTVELDSPRRNRAA
jgi:transcriptional regulator with XRE-family HTH domain